MSKKGSYIGGHTIIKIGKGRVSVKAKRWPYKTVKPSVDKIKPNKSERLLAERRKLIVRLEVAFINRSRVVVKTPIHS